jgi:putative transposase
MVAETENAELAETLITDCCWSESIDADQLYIHSDRGSPMISKAVALLLSDLGVTKSLSRPHVSNDNPYSEAHFKTLKYRPEFPKNFGSIEDARQFCRGFFKWYNFEHYHSGIAYMTPGMVHSGKAEACNKARQRVLDKAFDEHPGRFSRRPKVAKLPKEAWINKPKKPEAEVLQLATACSGVAVCV